VRRYVLIVSKKGLRVSFNDRAVPAVAFGGRRLSVSRRETAALAVVAAILVPLLMLVGRAVPLPSLLERGIQSLIPGLADGTARGWQAAAPSRFGTLPGATLNARVVLPVSSAPSSRGGISTASVRPHRVAGSRGARAADVRVRGIAARVPAPDVTRTSPATETPTPPTSGPGDGGGGPGPGGGGPGGPGTPPVPAGVNATASVGVEAGPAGATAVAAVSAATSGVSVAATVADLSIGADAAVDSRTDEAPQAAVTVETGQAAVPDVTVTVGNVAVSTVAGVTPA
jgi:hypothetical protein